MRQAFTMSFLRLVLAALVMSDCAMANKTVHEPRPVEQQQHYVIRIRPFRADEKIPVIVLWSDGKNSEVVDARDFHDALLARNRLSIYTVPHDMVFSFADNDRSRYTNLVADRTRSSFALSRASREVFLPPRFTTLGGLSHIAAMNRLAEHLRKAPCCRASFSLTTRGEGT